MTRRTAQMVRSPVARRAPTARSWALTPRCGRRTVERRRPGWLGSQVADPRGSVSANDGSYVTIDRGQRPPGSASRFGQSRVSVNGGVIRSSFPSEVASMDHATAAAALLATPFAASLLLLTLRLLPVIARFGQLIVTFHAAGPTPASCYHFETQLQDTLRELGRIIVEWTYNHLEPDDPLLM